MRKRSRKAAISLSMESPIVGISEQSRGLPPGTPIYIGEREPTQSKLSLYVFDEDAWSLECPATVAALLDFIDPEKVNWINVNGLTGGAVERLCERLGVHPLAVADILNTAHRPKVEQYEDYLFMITKMLSPHEDGSVEYEQVSLIVRPHLVVTIQETPGDCFGVVRERIETGSGRVRRKDAVYLAYGLLDLIVDNYFSVVEGIGDRLEGYELDAAHPEDPTAFMSGLQGLKSELLRLRRAIWPVRDSVAALMRLEGALIPGDLIPFLRDLHENLVQVIEALETYRENAASILEIYLSSVSNRMNEVMKVLTIISTIFIPLTFLAGVYGMNFQYMPELSRPWAYPALWALMLAIAGGMIRYFKRKHWF
jgi:magnesium transporter